MSVDPVLIARATASFERRFGHPPDHVIHAPGRVNLIGEHTDYNDGFVLPMAINFGTVVAISADPGGAITAVAADYADAEDRFPARLPIPMRNDAEWTDHVRGIVSVLLSRGHGLNGAKLAIAGNVPQGAGLSSSASLGVALGLAFATVNALEGLDPTQLALVGQKSENDFVGTACGIMDQLVSARAEAGAAMLIDCRSLETRAMAMPEDMAVLIVHSGVRRGLAESAYNDRRAQCEAVARHLGVQALRDADMAMLRAAESSLDPVAFRRARHVITENARTRNAANALAAGDWTQLGRLMAESHTSMREDFEITVPKVDALVAVLQDAIGETGGARMTGGGFGGCCVALLPVARLGAVRDAVAHHYQTPDGQTPLMINAIPSAGAARVFPSEVDSPHGSENAEI